MGIPTKRQRGFTLVELLVVIGIIAVLIGILLPTISRARDSANQTACQATLRDLGHFLTMYQGDFKGSFPYGRYIVQNVGSLSKAPDDQYNASNLATFVWWSVIRKYMKQGKNSNWDNAVFQQSDRFMQAFNCPLGHNREGGNDYGCNPVVMPDRNFEGDQWNNPQVTPNVGGAATGTTKAHNIYKPLTTKEVPADCAVLWDACEIPNSFTTQYCVSYGLDADAGQRYMTDGAQFYSYRFRNNASIATDPAVGDATYVNPGPNQDSGAFPDAATIRWRHQRNTSSNFLMGDGSVRSFKITTTDSAGKVKGELLRRNIRPKAPNYYLND